MSRRKKLEEGLSDLFSSRIPSESSSLEEESKDKAQDRAEPGTTRPASSMEEGGVITSGDVDTLEQQTAPASEDNKADEGDLRVSPDEGDHEPQEETLEDTAVVGESGMDSPPQESSSAGEETQREIRAQQAESRAAEWMEQRPEASRDLQAFAQAVRDMPLAPVQEEELKAEELEDEAVELELDRLVIFDLGETSFGVDVHSVLTIIKMLPVCPIPHSAEYVSGLINLRGQIIPVLDMGKRIGVTDREMTEDWRIVVVEMEKRLFGLIVDCVRSVVQIPSEAIKEPSRMMTSVKDEYLKGIVETEYGLVLLLALDRLLQR